jgi:PilZ domain
MGYTGAAAMPLANARSEEVVVVDRRRNTRIIVSVPGSYMLADHRNAAGERRTYPCRAVNLSPQAIALAAPVSGRIGERTFATIDHLGKFKGSIIRILDGGFVMSVVATDQEREKLAAKIDWFEQFKNFDVTDQRADARFVPENPRSRIVLADGRSEECFVLDLSASGAAISAQTVPQIGDVIALASIVARVVRRFDGGFAVRFVEKQDVQRIEARLVVDTAGYPMP